MKWRNEVRPEEAAKAAHVHVRQARNALDEGWLDSVEHHLTAADELLCSAGGLDTPVSPSKESDMEGVKDIYLRLDDAERRAEGRKQKEEEESMEEKIQAWKNVFELERF